MLKDNKLPTLKLPSFPLKIKNEQNKLYIFDDLRRKYIRLTPEEWVRQNFVHYLIKGCNYPKGKLGNEIEIKLNGLQRRCDTVVYGNDGKAVAIIEFKAPKIHINQKVFDQIFGYNLKLKVPYLIISNGLQHYTCKIEHGKPVFLADIPTYQQIST